jgi:hypothetical protein
MGDKEKKHYISSSECVDDIDEVDEAIECGYENEKRR